MLKELLETVAGGATWEACSVELKGVCFLLAPCQAFGTMLQTMQGLPRLSSQHQNLVRALLTLALWQMTV